MSRGNFAERGGGMAARLTDKQKKKIVADYLECQSVNLAAKRNGVSWDSAKKALEEAGEIEKKLEQKKNEELSELRSQMESALCELDSYYSQNHETLSEHLFRKLLAN